MRQIVDANGNITLAESYEPYGSLLSSNGTASSIFGYSGEEVDTYIKLLFLRARYYSPEMARFLSKDVWRGDYTRPQSFNAWMYVEGEPVSHTDPSGQWWCRPSPSIPSCEDWMTAALHRLLLAGPVGASIWGGFSQYDSWPRSIGILFDTSGASYTPPVLNLIHLASSDLNDSIPSVKFDNDVAAFAHETMHILQKHVLYTTQDEVDAYVREGFVRREFGLAGTWAYDSHADHFFNSLYETAWENGLVTNNYRKLCRARRILTTDEYTRDAHDTYNSQPLAPIMVGALLCDCLTR